MCRHIEGSNLGDGVIWAWFPKLDSAETLPQQTCSNVGIGRACNKHASAGSSATVLRPTARYACRDPACLAGVAG
jgi:hypothetical protein